MPVRAYFLLDGVAQLSITVTKCLRETTYEEEKSTLAHGLREVKALSLSSFLLQAVWHGTLGGRIMEEAANFRVVREQDRRRGGSNTLFKGMRKWSTSF